MKARLEAAGHRSIFLDFDPADGIPVGRDWEVELYARLRSCRAFVVLCSEHSMTSHWCFAEITHAKALGKYVAPVKIGPCNIDPILTSRQIVDLTVDPEDGYRRLLDGLRQAGLDPNDAFVWDGARPPTLACLPSTSATPPSSSVATRRSATVWTPSAGCSSSAATSSS